MLHFIPAGRPGPSYATRVNTFNWDNFYTRLGGADYISLARDQMRSSYEFILIDSRTGVTDTAGICTMELPDKLVACFALNTQSIAGVEGIINSVTEFSDRSKRNIVIFPVAMRVELGEDIKLKRRQSLVQSKFNSIIQMENLWPGQYWERTEVPYVPFKIFREEQFLYYARSKIFLLI